MASLADIQKLRKLTGAGMMDCKKALEEAGDNIDAAVEIVRAKGQAIAAKRSDREASEGCVLCKAENGFGAIIALKCETDFVATNADFIKLAQTILDAAFEAKAKDIEEVKALTIDGKTIADLAKLTKNLKDDSVTMNAYRVYGKVTKSSGPYATYSVSDGDSKIQVYSSSTDQYAFLEPFIDKMTELEVTLCNWNGKQLKLTVLSAKYYNTLHFQK